ncbi:MAG: hypothetical protein AVDCRST_MAG32-3094, partial [uncultured Nocardioides sp.]
GRRGAGLRAAPLPRRRAGARGVRDRAPRGRPPRRVGRCHPGGMVPRRGGDARTAPSADRGPRRLRRRVGDQAPQARPRVGLPGRGRRIPRGPGHGLGLLTRPDALVPAPPPGGAPGGRRRGHDRGVRRRRLRPGRRARGAQPGGCLRRRRHAALVPPRAPVGRAAVGERGPRRPRGGRGGAGGAARRRGDPPSTGALRPRRGRRCRPRDHGRGGPPGWRPGRERGGRGLPQPARRRARRRLGAGASPRRRGRRCRRPPRARRQRHQGRGTDGAGGRRRAGDAAGGHRRGRPGRRVLGDHAPRAPL